MTKKKRNTSGTGTAEQTAFVHDAKSRPWLALLLEGYRIVDRGVAAAVEREKEKGRTLACAKGCAHCCRTHADIPIYPLEIIGISWFAAEKLKGPDRERLKAQLHSFTRGSPCPFLIDTACVIHPLRPMACRQFNVFGRPCAEEEDPFHSRRHDVMDPVKKHIDQAFFVMLPYYGVEKESERKQVVDTGSFHRMVRDLHKCNWHELAGKMERHDYRAKGNG